MCEWCNSWWNVVVIVAAVSDLGIPGSQKVVKMAVMVAVLPICVSRMAKWWPKGVPGSQKGGPREAQGGPRWPKGALGVPFGLLRGALGGATK